MNRKPFQTNADYLTFVENREKFPWDELKQYAGQQIAWSWDATKILAFGCDHEEVFRKLDAAGIDPSEVVFDYVDDGTSYI